MRLTIQCGIVKLTKCKQEALDREYSNIQDILQLQNEGLDWLPLFSKIPLYSANKQNAIRYNTFSLRNDLINLKQTKSFWFLRIPVHGIWGGIKVPIKPHRPFPKNSKLRESKLIKKNGKYIAMLCFEFNAPERRTYSSILAVDFGERVTATSVILRNGNVMKAKFFGRDIRGIRRHYNWLRKRLQKKGLNRVVTRIGNKEGRCVNNILHRVSKEIVSLAGSTDSCIVLGDLKGIRQRARGKRFNRIVSSMPYFKLGEMIEYKAEILGITVVKTNEAYTSKLCHICNTEGNRRSQGRFVCPVCGEYNADLNGAINIGKRFERFLGYMLRNGAFCEQALNGLVDNFQSSEILSVKAR